MELINTNRDYHVGDWVVYTREKYSPSPGPRAKNVSPAAHGELYSYEVDKFWIVQDVTDQGAIVVVTRRGKVHRVSIDDPRLRKAAWWECFLYRSRFVRSSSVETKQFKTAI